MGYWFSVQTVSVKGSCSEADIAHGVPSIHVSCLMNHYEDTPRNVYTHALCKKICQSKTRQHTLYLNSLNLLYEVHAFQTSV